MKTLSFILSVLLLLNLLGCGAKEAAPATDPRLEPVCGDRPTEETTEPETAPTEEIIPTAPSTEFMIPPALGEDDKGPAAYIYTDYYRLKAPIRWGNTGLSKITPLDNGAYSLAIYEHDSYIDFGGGKLCTLMMVPTEDETYKDFPDYELLCALDTPEGSYYVVALFPTDVQFNADTVEDYNAMAEELMDVLYTIRPVGDIEMAMP